MRGLRKLFNIMKNKKYKYPLVENTITKKEINSVIELLKSGKKLTYGDNVTKLEKKIANFHSRKYSVMVNSGSSANLLGVASILYSKKFDFKVGDEVIVPALSWSTTYSPLIQLGLKLVFVDIDRDTFNISVEKIKKAISKKTKAIFCVNILGSVCDYTEISKITKKHNLFIFEDNCESFGAMHKKRLSGKYGLFSSISSYHSHHINTIEGGFLLTDSFEVYCNALSLRSHGWSREQPKNSRIGKEKISNFEKKFKFYLPGFNLRPTEINAVIGLQQMKKISSFIKHRKNNAKIFYKIFKGLENIILQEYSENNSFFSFSFIFPDTKNKEFFFKLFEKIGFETRPIISGDILKHKMLNYANYKIIGDTKNISLIEKCGLMIGNKSSPFTKVDINLLLTLKNKIIDLNKKS